MTRTATSRRPTALTDAQLTVAWQAASLLLGYPDEELLGRARPDRAGGRPSCPSTWADPLRACVARARRDAADRAGGSDYVDTFDNRRRHNLFLTYFAHGDTRKRGMALLRFKQTYLASGFELTDTELPDHLCVVLEYAATVDHEQGRAADPRPPRRARAAAASRSPRPGSRWAGAVEAVTATLPPLRGDEMDAVRRLAAEGPPAEEVGLTPYATPAFDPGPAHPDGPTPLPMPSFPGRR